MKKFMYVLFVMLTLVASYFCWVKLTGIVEEESDDITRVLKEEAIRLSDYLDEKYDDAISYVNDKVVMVFNKD